MPERRIKSIMHGSAPSTRIYHHEHRSSNGRQNPKKIRRIFRKRARNENREFNYMDRKGRMMMEWYNNDPDFRRNFKEWVVDGYVNS